MHEARSRSNWWKWHVCGLLLLATTVNYMDRQTLANAAVRVTKEFSLNKEQFGNIEMAFGFAFAAGAVCFGFLADRFRVYWLYPVVLSGWSIMGIASAHTTGYHSLLVCRILLGFFEAGHWPCALKTTYALLAEKDRTMGNSVLQSGASIGAIVTPPLMIWLMTEDLSSWRLAFQVIGAVGFIWVFLWFASIRKTDLDVSTAKDANGAAGSETLLSVVCSWRFLALAVVVAAIHPCWQIFRAWMPQFLQEGRGYTEVQALSFNSVYYIATDIGCIAAGAATLWLARRFTLSAHTARRWVFAAACLCTSCSVAVALLPKGPMLLAAMLVVGFGSLAMYPCYYSFKQELSVSNVGRIVGLLGAWAWLSGSPLHKVFGKTIDLTGSYDLGLALVGLVPWLGVLAMWLLWDRQKKEPSSASVTA